MFLSQIQWRAELRNFRKHFGSNFMIVTLLSVGLASTIVIFAFLKSLVLDPLPFANAHNLQQVGLVSEQQSSGVDSITGKMLADWRTALPATTPMFAVAQGTINLSGQNALRPERYNGAYVYGAMWTELGVKPQLGRDFSASDFLPNAAPLAMISDQIWRNRFGAAPDILGRTVRVNGISSTVVAVMAPNMSFPTREQVWTQARLESKSPQLEYSFDVFMNSSGAFESHLATLQQLFLEQKKSDSDLREYLRVAPRKLADWAVGFETRMIASIMFTAVILLLLAVCLNAASVLLVRLLSEQGQNSVRLALGSGWVPLAISTFLQSLFLAGLGAFFAHYLARAGGSFVLNMFEGSEEGFPIWIDVSNVVGRQYLIGFALLSAMLTALLPILRLRQMSLNSALRQNSRSVTSTQTSAKVLIFLQVALSCTVVMCAAEVVQQVRAILKHQVGIDSANLLTGRVGLFPSAYPDDAALSVFRAKLTQGLRAHPEIISASLATALPGSSSDRVEVSFGAMRAEDALASYAAYADQYFLDTYKIRLLAGRVLTVADIDNASVAIDSACSALIDARTAEPLGGVSAAVGASIRINAKSPQAFSCTVVGVVSNIELNQIDGILRPAVIMPITKVSAHFLTIAVRVKGDATAFKPKLSALVAAADADLPVYWLRTFAEVLATSTAGNRVLSYLFSALALIALGLSAAGLYGMLSFQAQSRTREVGLRLALGARAVSILRAMFLPSLVIVGLGVLSGTLLAIFPARFLGGIVNAPGVHHTTLIAGLSVLLLFVLTALAAAVKPAMLALSVTPQTALRQD
jgi:putative ABC transport system permease protein